MKSLSKICLMAVIAGLFSFQASAQTTKYKCLLQMANYVGEGAYVAVSLIDAKGEYEKTLYVMGDDKKWYKSLKEWNRFNAKKPDVSAKTGASVTGGDRSVTVFEIENSKINKGYKIRFETAVEDQKYYVGDAEIPLTTAGITEKAEGKGYIRYVKLSNI
ncbi:DUF2271 domain-containing protein [Flavobacterium circumlabens]|uniref:DUF2271 domain-containing protein n=1 Tax=Flavobacterium circumlabens TaxID=2133765 RepID=A0A4Y7UFK5_9FLAO|nr:DUF2271 domain-containing protein [Flavobacterium circumlabens]TCN59895.1 uncharacterized protein DUF2271 [Flavobacterium circumlabens]TEB45146.1 DUF2271 domain-containing protein [Flavobacterium circumlabens]